MDINQKKGWLEKVDGLSWKQWLTMLIGGYGAVVLTLFIIVLVGILTVFSHFLHAQSRDVDEFKRDFAKQQASFNQNYDAAVKENEAAFQSLQEGYDNAQKQMQEAYKKGAKTQAKMNDLTQQSMEQGFKQQQTLMNNQTQQMEQQARSWQSSSAAASH